MNSQLASPCQCTNCPGSSCTCGCQDTGARNLHAGAACACAGRCGCDAAESGCQCPVPNAG